MDQNIETEVRLQCVQMELQHDAPNHWITIQGDENADFTPELAERLVLCFNSLRGIPSATLRALQSPGRSTLLPEIDAEITLQTHCAAAYRQLLEYFNDGHIPPDLIQPVLLMELLAKNRPSAKAAANPGGRLQSDDRAGAGQSDRA